MKRIKLLLIPLITLALFSLKAGPAYAGFLGDLWDSVKCVTDINCTVRAAATAGENFLFRNLVGKDFEKVEEEDVQSMIKGRWDAGLAGGVSQIGAMVYAYPPPVHLADYVRYKLSNNILSSPVSAQTFGSFFLSPIHDFWRGMRDIAYGLFLVIMVVIGFMIILRQEISPRVVVTFTNSLPKILLGLILITFSFPLIGLIIDVGAVFASELVGGLLVSKFPEFTGLAQAFQPLQEVNGAAPEVGAAVLVSSVLPVIIGNFLENTTGLGSVQAFVSLLLSAIFCIVAVIVFALAFFRLIGAYISLLVYTLFSPLLVLAGSLPGQEGTITNFGKKIVAKTLTFPAVLFFLGLGLFFSYASFFGDVSYTTEIGKWGHLSTALESSPITANAGILGSLLAIAMLVMAFKAPGAIESSLIDSGKPKKKK